MVGVTISRVGGSDVLGPIHLPPSTRLVHIIARILNDRAQPHCHVRLLLGSQVLHESTTLQELAGGEEALQLTAIFEYTLTKKERQDFVKSFAGEAQPLKLFQQMPEAARSDDEVVMAAIRRDPQAVEFAAGWCAKDKDFMLMAIRANRRSLQFASQELKADQELVLEAAALNGYALRYADPMLGADPKFMMKAVCRNGAALEYAHEAIKANKEVVRAAVRNNGAALAFADTTMRADPDVVRDAVQQMPCAQQFALIDQARMRNGALGAVAPWRR